MLIIYSYKKLKPGDEIKIQWKEIGVSMQPAMVIKEATAEEFRNQEQKKDVVWKDQTLNEVTMRRKHKRWFYAVSVD